MVEKKPVSPRRQMVYSVIPILDLIASYKIQKLRLWVLIFWVGGMIVQHIHGYAVYGEAFFDWEKDMDLFPEPVYISNFVLYIAVSFLLQIIVMRRWSLSWNEKLH
jgi:hypothetical protein